MTLPKLLQITAADMMQRDIITISRGDTLRDAIELMTENHIGGLPVMDQRSRCIGLVTATDILTYEQDHCQETEEGNAESARYYDSEAERWETIRLSTFALEELGAIPVSDVMACDLISVERDTPILQVAKTMRDASVHRVLVMDEENRLFGIIAAIDFVHLVANA